MPPIAGDTTDVGTISLRRPGRLFASSSVQGLQPHSLFVVDTDAGTLTLVGTPANTSNGLSDLSVNPATGTLYLMHGASLRGSELLTVNPDTAAVLSRATITTAQGLVGSDALAHDQSGVLYVGAWVQNQGRLLIVDPVTGVASQDILVSGSGNDVGVSDLAVDPTSGDMWATRGGSYPGRLVRIDPATGAVTRVLDLAGSPIVTAIAIRDDGVMFVSLAGARLAKVDTVTGAVTFIGTGFGGPMIAGLGFEW